MLARRRLWALVFVDRGDLLRIQFAGVDTPFIERCRREIAVIEEEILAGNPDLQGLCLGLSDWSTELRILQNEQRRRT